MWQVFNKYLESIKGWMPIGEREGQPAACGGEGSRRLPGKVTAS